MFKFFAPYFFVIATILTGFQVPNFQDEILLGLKSNNSKNLVKYFSSIVNLSLNKEELICTKFQSELILADYFKENKVFTAKLVSVSGNKENSSYIIYEIKNAKGTFQVLVKFMKIKAETAVVEFKIY